LAAFDTGKTALVLNPTKVDAEKAPSLLASYLSYHAAVDVPTNKASTASELGNIIFPP
jgi:hypothetical protein